jgi:hypothetical protein
MSYTFDIEQGAFRRGLPSIKWEISGEIDIPVLTSLGGPKYNPRSFGITTAVVSAREIGTATYDLQVISYNSSGGSPITHIDTTVTFTAAIAKVNLTVSTANIGFDRNVILRLKKNSGTPSSNIEVTLLP